MKSAVASCTVCLVFEVLLLFQSPCVQRTHLVVTLSDCIKTAKEFLLCSWDEKSNLLALARDLDFDHGSRSNGFPLSTQPVVRRVDISLNQVVNHVPGLSIFIIAIYNNS